MPQRNKYYKALKKDFKCDELWSNPLINEPSKYCLPPKEIPKKWEFDFAYGGRVDVKNFYWQDGGWGGNWQVRRSGTAKSQKISLSQKGRIHLEDETSFRDELFCPGGKNLA